MNAFTEINHERFLDRVSQIRLNLPRTFGIIKIRAPLLVFSVA